MRNKNVLIILIVLALIAAVAVAALVANTQPEAPTTVESITRVDGEATAEPSGEENLATSTDAQAEALQLTGLGYVYIQASGEGRWFELPETEHKLEITREDTDGSEIFNVINLSPEGVFVESASCDNQDCVEQGLVTLENKEERVLRNLIVCLPNEVSVELFSAEEMMQMILDAQAAAQE